MSGSPFIPNLNTREQLEAERKEVISGDYIVKNILSWSQYVVLFLFTTIPIFFTPGLWSSLDFDKVVLTIVSIFLVTVMASFMALRITRFNTVLPASLGLFWLLVVAAFVSAILSGDVTDAVWGSLFEVQTAGFLLVLAGTMTLPLILQGNKTRTIGAILLFCASSAIVILYNLLRFIFGADFLTLGSFHTLTLSSIGDFNDLGLFSGLVVILCLVTLVLLPLRPVLRYIISAIILVSLGLLAVINFFNIWLVVGFFALLLFIYLLSADRFLGGNNNRTKRMYRLPLLMSAVVSVISLLFVLYGSYFGGVLSHVINVDYVEVIPSPEGTLGIAKGVYQDNFWLGIGPNRFSDAWRLHKDPAINDTIFWDTDFNTGSGFVPTLFVNLGILGGLLLISFHVWFFYLGYRVLLKSNQDDPHWYYVSVISFLSACFIWIMSYVYEPGATILIIGGLFTGMTYVASATMLPSTVRKIPLVINQKRGFFIMSLVMILITFMLMSSVSVVKQYVAQSNYNQARANTEETALLEEVAMKSFDLFQDDRFMRSLAQLELMKLNQMLSLSSPTEEDQKNFVEIVKRAHGFIQLAIDTDKSDPDNELLLAGIYRALAVAGVDGSISRALSHLNSAQALDKVNPGYNFIAAEIAVGMEDFELARTEIEKALKLKPNFTEAIFLSTQIDIKEGNVDSAIVKTRSLISLEPNNPTRYFQLGVLLSASAKYMEAISAFDVALELNPEFANARYMLALALVAVEDRERALENLRIVEISNPNNQQLLELIQDIQSGRELPAPDFGGAPLSENTPKSEAGTVTSSAGEDTDLVEDVNTVKLDTVRNETNEEVLE